MKRISKLLGLGLAVVAMSAMFASAASAQQFTAGAYPATLSATQNGEHVFTVENELSVTCPTATFSAALPEQTGTVAGVTAKYGNEEAKCKAFGIINATIKMNSCTYTFVDETNVESGMHHEGSADVVCTGTPITIVAGTCEVQVGNQAENVGPIDYKIDTAPNPDTGEINPEIETGIDYNKTKDGLFCPLSGTGTKGDGAYTGSTTVTANSGGPVALGLTP